MLGSTFPGQEISKYIFIKPDKNELNLFNYYNTFNYIRNLKPDAVIHLAAKVGGVKNNTDKVCDFYSENIIINTNLLEACHNNNINNVVSLLSTCIYPENATYPLTENQIHNGPPHQSNYGYAYAKRMLDIHTKTLRDQYNRRYICAIPNNLYGKNDNFDLNNSHVIPAIIRKIFEAKKNNHDVELWGNGNPLREFTYSNDIAKILMFLLENYDSDEPINIGNTKEISIKEVANKIKKILDFKGNIIWNTNKPTGQYRKPSSNKKLLKLGWKKDDYTPLDEGLQLTVDWFLKNYPNVRGI